MIVYRTQDEIVSSAQRLARLHELYRELRVNEPRHERVVELLIEFGELEAGVADALCPEADWDHPMARAFRQASLRLGRVLYHSWKKKPGATAACLHEFGCALESLSALTLPESVKIGLPEGYAYYGLYPETFLEAADTFFRLAHPTRVVGIGIRSIGTSLSAVVCATLQELGCEVHSYTVRPRGHPFDRRLVLAPPLEEEWRALGDSHWLVIDEGPGLSGSSLAGTAQKLAELGIPDERIILFPSAEPDGQNLINEKARDHWRRHDKFTTSFEQVWLESGRLAESLKTCELMDLSEGKWRELFYGDESDYPAAQPYHERRKYLSRETSPARLFKFAGLGRYGAWKLERAQQLADARFAPRVLELVNGFLATEFVEGSPLSAASVSRKLLDTLARYLAFLKQTFPTGRAVPYDEIMEMLRINIQEGIGQEWLKHLDALEKARAVVCENSTVRLDARMLPHEWIYTADGFIKTDGVEHHNDHFFPSCQDIAWDIAGTCIEFDLSQPGRAYLIDHYQALTRDESLAKRLPFYSIAYLAYRLGYVMYAASPLGDAPDAARFRKLGERYVDLLKQELVKTINDKG